jgi:hypothetical protein
VYRMTTAFVRAAAALRLRRLERVAAEIAKRKAAHASQEEIDVETARQLAMIFRALRPFFYTAYGKCLLDSLVLIEFLAAYDLFPIWVIGVRPMPFAAHSWVQIARFILNGSPEYARAFAPIMAI